MVPRCSSPGLPTRVPTAYALRGYSERVPFFPTFEAVIDIEDSRENQEDKCLSQGIELL